MNFRIIKRLGLSFFLLAIVGIFEINASRFAPKTTTRKAQGQRQMVTHSTSSEGKHNELINEFEKFQQDVGLQDTASNKRPIIVRGQTATQEQFNAAREAIHKILRKDVLNSDDIKSVEVAINNLGALRPARWPRPQDYNRLLQARGSSTTSASALKKHEADDAALAKRIAEKEAEEYHARAQKQQQAPAVIYSTNAAEMHTQLQREFEELQQQVGLKASASDKQPRRVHGQTANQQQFNAARRSIHEIFRKKILTEQDIKDIDNRIKYLRILNPARWPRPDDYERLLQARLKATTSSSASSVSHRDTKHTKQ